MRRRNITLAGGLALLAGSVRADLADPIAQADVISTIGVARVADEAGDPRLVEWLGTAARRDLITVAVRASPFAHAPERLVPQLAQLLCGRDPLLAPESAHAMAAIAERITPSRVALREGAVADFTAARKALECVREQAAPVRADLVRAAQLLDAVLAQLSP
ncbi:MAG TPA: hypothetical protein VFZ61_33460 [Polyangiales bacterium]